MCKGGFIMTLEEYIDVSEKYNRPFARPADKEDFYSKYIRSCFINDSNVKRDKKAYSLWKNADFAKCYHIIPRDVDILIYYDNGLDNNFADYYVGIIITENYMCKFYIGYDHNEYLLKYEHKNGDIIEQSYSNLISMTNAINDLVKDDTNLFEEISKACIPLQNDLDWYNNHVKYKYDDTGDLIMVLIDDLPIYDYKNYYWLV